MKLIITQNTGSTEEVTTGLLDKLYDLVTNNLLSNDSVLQGRLHTDYTYEEVKNALQNAFPNLLYISATDYYIRFADSKVLEVLINNNIGDGSGIKLTDTNISLGNIFLNNTEILYFNELYYFTGGSLAGCTNLKEIDVFGPRRGASKLTRLPSLNGCTQLTKFNGHDSETGVMDLPESINGWGGGGVPYVFSGVAITKMIIHAPLTNLNSNSMYGSPSTWTTIDIRPYEDSLYYETPISIWLLCSWQNTNCRWMDSYRHITINGNLVTSITIPETIFELKRDTFPNDKDLVSCTFHNNITSIGYRCFYQCSNLVIPSLSLPALSTLGEQAFTDTKIQSIQNLGAITTIPKNCFSNCTILTSATLPQTVTSIDESAFENCTALANVAVPNTVTYVGGNAFNGTAWYTNLYNNSSDGFINIGKTCYAYKGTIPNSITIPSGVVTVGENLFNGNTTITSVTLSSSVKRIGYRAFRNCSNLASVSGFDYVETIGSDGFVNNSSLTGALTLTSVVSIGAYAFIGAAITSLTLGQSCTSIGAQAFESCIALTSVTVNAVNPPSLGNKAFNNCTNLAHIYVPSGSVTTYKSRWSTYDSIIEAIPT